MAVEAQRAPRPAPLVLFARRRPGVATSGLIGPPVLWLVLLFVVPVGIAVVYSLGVLSFFPGEAKFSFSAWKGFLDWSSYLQLFVKRSLKVAVWVSIASVILAYPVAYFLALCTTRRKYTLLLLIVTPAFVSYFLRLLAMKTVLGDNGLLNTIAYSLGRNQDHPIPQLIYSQTAVIVTLVFVYVPFVALPIFVSLENLDRRLLEAASDLGATRRQAFWRVTFKLSLPGVIAGFVFVFIPTLGEYFTPLIVGGTTGFLFGNSISDLFGPSLDWQTGSVLSIFLVVVVVVLMAVFARFLSLKRVAG